MLGWSSGRCGPPQKDATGADGGAPSGPTPLVLRAGFPGAWADVWERERFECVGLLGLAGGDTGGEDGNAGLGARCLGRVSVREGEALSLLGASRTSLIFCGDIFLAGSLEWKLLKSHCHEPKS